MDKTSFYVYVSSQDCLGEYPGNIHDFFTNSLRPGILLYGEYEVSLANIKFTPDIIAIKGRDLCYLLVFMVQASLNVAYYKSQKILTDARFNS